MFDLQFILNVASIAVGFVAAVCFCIGAATNGPKNIALSSATIVGSNPATMRSLSGQRAQYLIGSLFLVASFGLQVGVVLVPKEAQVGLPLILQSARDARFRSCSCFGGRGFFHKVAHESHYSSSQRIAAAN